MPISIRTIHVIVVVLPVFCTGVIRRINVYAIYLLCIEIFQKLQRMVIIRFNQGMPKAAVRSILHSVN